MRVALDRLVTLLVSKHEDCRRGCSGGVGGKGTAVTNKGRWGGGLISEGNGTVRRGIGARDE